MSDYKITRRYSVVVTVEVRADTEEGVQFALQSKPDWATSGCSKRHGCYDLTLVEAGTPVPLREPQ